MYTRSMPLAILLLVLFSAPLTASETPEVQFSDRAAGMITTGPISATRSQIDSLIVMGPWESGASFNGQFQDQLGSAHWNDWTHRDLTVAEDGNHWQAHIYNADGLAGHSAGNLAAWCGTLDYPACDAPDVEGGYGNNWDDALSWTAIVAEPSLPSVVTIEAFVNLDIEPGYDFLTLELRTSDDTFGFATIGQYDSIWMNQHMNWEITIPAGDYFGPGGNEVELRFVVTSDGGWSDEDCNYYSAGACQIDDITVTLDNGNISTFDDFEDGTLGNWVPKDPIGSGDFSQLRDGLSDMDNCLTNSSVQVCFVDDGVVVPGTGGTECVDWCYGPGGFILNFTGGLVTHGKIKNAVMSPVMPWPEDYDGGLYEFDVYVHEPLTMDSGGIFYGWGVRSVTGSDPDAINSASWLSTNFLFYGGPEYRRHHEDISGFIEPGATYVQVRFFIWDFPTWDWHLGPNGTPAPYYDNVRVTALNTYGPSVLLSDADLANDSFPATGVLDPENLASNSVRFDSGKSDGNEAQDYIQAFISTQGEGTYLVPPTMYYRLIPNSVFDGVRTSGLPNSGSISGSSSRESATYKFDLPDTGFFYPGDIIHYYFTAAQETPSGLETVMIPADTLGFSQNPWGANSQSPGLSAYDQKFTVRALPSMYEGGSNPNILIWDDTCDPEFTTALRHDLNQAQAFTYHNGFDLYRRNAAGGGSHLARDVSPEILAGYSAVFYFSGKSSGTLLGANWEEQRADLDLLIQYLEENEERGLFINGDHVLAALNNNTDGQHLLHDFLGITLTDEDIIPLISNTTVPRVLSVESTLFENSGIDEWLVTGYCPESRGMNAVETAEGAVRLAEFAAPSGQGGYYPYAAAAYFQGPNLARCFSMPYDFRRIQQLPGWEFYGLSMRSHILRILASGFSGMGFPVVDMTPAPDRLVLAASAYPNPFNPATTISFNLPGEGRLSLKVYNVRGQLVRALADTHFAAGPGKIEWNGEDQSGGSVASGVYFYELRFGDDVITEKMMMLK